MLHVYFRHRFTSTGYSSIDRLFRLILYVALMSWAGAVCYSRYDDILQNSKNRIESHFTSARLYLTYHSAAQVIWGASVGIIFGLITYVVTELIPSRRPQSFLGRLRITLLSSRISVWMRIRDGWAIWADGGREDEWQAWNRRWRTRFLDVDKLKSDELKKRT